MKRAYNAYIVGSGIASLAAAVYLIRHKIVPPERVTIFELRRTMAAPWALQRSMCRSRPPIRGAQGARMCFLRPGFWRNITPAL